MDLDKSDVSTKTFSQFIGYISKLTPEEFYGVAKLEGIDIVDEEQTDIENGVLRYKAPDLLLEEVLDKFCFLNRQRRKNLMKLLKKTVKGR